MKKLTATLTVLMLIAVLFTACTPFGGTNAPTPAPTAETTSAPTAAATQQASETPEPEVTPAPSAAPTDPASAWTSVYPETVPEYTGSPLYALDPETDLFIGMGRQDRDIYPDTYWGGMTFWVISKGGRQLGASFDSKNHMIIEVRELESDAFLADKRIYDWNGFSIHHYLSIGEFDLDEYCRAALEVYKGEERIRNTRPTTEDYLLVQELETEWVRIEYEAREAYYQFDLRSFAESFPGDPDYHIYQLDILFDDLNPGRITDETLTTMHLTVDGESYDIEFGEWRVHSENPEEFKWDNTGIMQRNMCAFSAEGTPYTDGYAYIPGVCDFVANRDLTITGLRAFGSEGTRVLGARVTEDGESDKTHTLGDFYWDMKTPIELRKGQIPRIDVYIKDDRLLEYGFAGTIFFVMDYEIDGRPHSMLFSAVVKLDIPLWNYILSFEGYDTGKYYTCFDNLFNNTWVRELPAAWLDND